MITKIRSKIASYFRERAKVKVEQDIKSIKNVEFTIISCNCIGSRIYQVLKLPYNTPTVGLFFYAPCFVKFVKYFDIYMKNEITFTDDSLYPEGNVNRINNGMYPLGRLGDIEIHFLHHKDEKNAKLSWNSLCTRVNYERLFFVFTDRDNCTPSLIQEFDNIQHKNKVCFTAKDYGLDSCVQIRKFREQDCVGNLYDAYENFYRNFSFSKWIDR